jgi:hypothetical protein
LESWVPRRPSARLKEQIFAANAKPENARLKTNVFSYWLNYMKAHLHGADSAELPGWVKFAPACCILLIITLLSIGRQEKSAYLAVATGSNAMAGLSSNLLALCATDSHHHRENVWSAVTFDWTKDGGSLSTIGSYPDGKTNIHKL